MKTFAIIFVCSLALVSANNNSAQAKKDVAAEECKKEMNAGDDTSAIVNSKKVPTTEAESCLLECIYAKLGLIKDGKLNFEGAKAIAVEKFGQDTEKLNKADTIFKNCEAETTKNKSSEKCGLAKQFRSCIVNNDQLQFFPKS